MTLSLTLGQRETCNVTEAEAALGVSFEAVCMKTSQPQNRTIFQCLNCRIRASDIECGREQC